MKVIIDLIVPSLMFHKNIKRTHKLILSLDALALNRFFIYVFNAKYIKLL